MRAIQKSDLGDQTLGRSILLADHVIVGWGPRRLVELPNPGREKHGDSTNSHHQLASKKKVQSARKLGAIA